jgi:hypothetical protein
VATVVVYADDRTLVQRPKNYFFIALVSHKCYGTTPQTLATKRHRRPTNE